MIFSATLLPRFVRVTCYAVFVEQHAAQIVHGLRIGLLCGSPEPMASLFWILVASGLGDVLHEDQAEIDLRIHVALTCCSVVPAHSGGQVCAYAGQAEVICITQGILGGRITGARLREQRFHVSHGRDSVWMA